MRYGADLGTRVPLAHLAADCARWCPRHLYREGCGASFVDLKPPGPPDLPPAATMPLRGSRG